jgi:catechol 2,3-dioxygenase-like lactoylglutathione lyase family enzyme
MELKLEVVVIPVSDVDRAKAFYLRMGFREDIDVASPDGGWRCVQLTPPGSSCSIIIGKGVTSAKPGSIDRFVVAVSDIVATRAELVGLGVEVGEVFHDAGGSLGGGFGPAAAHAAGPDPQRRSYASYATFADPDGNVWMLQELTDRLPGRV